VKWAIKFLVMLKKIFSKIWVILVNDVFIKAFKLTIFARGFGFVAFDVHRKGFGFVKIASIF
jgi:hypothetical protein